MDVASFLTPIGLAVLIVLTMRDAQRDRAAENERRDQREVAAQHQRSEDSRQWLLMFSALTGKQVEIKATVERTAHAGQIIQGQMNQNLEEFKELFIMTFDMYMKNPPATIASVKRMQKALLEGDTEKAQAVVDETPLESEQKDKTE